MGLRHKNFQTSAPVNDVGFVIKRLRVRLLAVRCHAATLDKLFTHLYFRPRVLIV